MPCAAGVLLLPWTSTVHLQTTQQPFFCRRLTVRDLSGPLWQGFHNPSNIVNIFCAGGLFLPETPNSLVERGHFDKGRQVLRRIRGTQDVDIEFETIVLANEVTKTAPNPWRAIFK